MAETWPSDLPQYLLADGYAEGMADGRLVSPMDAGPAKVRRRSSAMTRPLRGRMVMSAAQLEDLQEFVVDTLLGGTLPFEFPSPVTGDPILVRFAETVPSWTSMGGDNWVVSLDFEVLP